MIPWSNFISLKTQRIIKKLRWKNILQGTAWFILRHSYRTTFVLFFLRTDVSSMFASAEEVRCSNLNFCSFHNLYCLNEEDQTFSSSQTRDKLKTLMIQGMKYIDCSYHIFSSLIFWRTRTPHVEGNLTSWERAPAISSWNGRTKRRERTGEKIGADREVSRKVLNERLILIREINLIPTEEVERDQDRKGKVFIFLPEKSY